MFLLFQTTCTGKVERERKWNYAASFKLRLELEKQSCYHKRKAFLISTFFSFFFFVEPVFNYCILTVT